MKKSKKILLTLSTFLCVLFSNALCMVNENGKRSAEEKQTVALDGSKRFRPDSFVRSVSDIGNSFLERVQREREIAIQNAKIQNAETRPRIKSTINSEAFVLAIEEARAELQQEEERSEQKLQDAFIKEAVDISPKLKELIFDKTNEEFILNYFVGLYHENK